MRLYIAEKPSLGKVIASALSSGTSLRMKREKNHIVMSNGDVVAWSAGHILAQAMPEVYGEQYKRWDLESLPCIPGKWVMHPKKETKDLFSNIKKLLKEADEVVNAGDADREGQLLIDEILDYCEYRGPVFRLLISDTNNGGRSKGSQEYDCPTGNSLD